jgi:hypothetical protein
VLYKGETVRLLRDLSEPALPKYSEGDVINIRRDEHGSPLDVELRFHVSSRAVTATVPFDAVEPVLSSTGGCSGVFWRLAKTGDTLIERVMHAMLDRGFEMRQGLNVVQLQYDRQDRFWRKGERLSDPTGAQVAVAGRDWDGCIVAFSGTQRFELEIRLRGRRDPYILLHQRWETYEQQRLVTHSSMSLLRVLLNLYHVMGAECCAIPLADNWLMDESWDSLLQQPYYPDLFIIPKSKLPAELPPVYRAQPLVEGKAILTTLPVKFSPTDDAIKPTERELKLNQLRVCKAIGEKAYDQLYEARNGTAGLYSDAKEAFYDAIRVARELNLPEEVEQLEKRLEHIKAVFRSQFS